jgi:hypothetical protein
LANENRLGHAKWRLVLRSLVLIDGNDAHRFAAWIGDSVASWRWDFVGLEVEYDSGSVADAFAVRDYIRIGSGHNFLVRSRATQKSVALSIGREYK